MGVLPERYEVSGKLTMFLSTMLQNGLENVGIQTWTKGASENHGKTSSIRFFFLYLLTGNTIQSILSIFVNISFSSVFWYLDYMHVKTDKRYQTINKQIVLLHSLSDFVKPLGRAFTDTVSHRREKSFASSPTVT